MKETGGRRGKNGRVQEREEETCRIVVGGVKWHEFRGGGGD